MRRLFVLFPAGATVERIEGYADLLSDFEPRDLSAACERVARMWKDQFVPPPAVLIERARDCRKERLDRERHSVGKPAPPAPGEMTPWSRRWRDLRRKLGRFPTPEEVEAFDE